MKGLIVAAVSALTLGGCVAVPAHYPAEAYYYPAPAVAVGVYSAPGYYVRHHRPHRPHRHRHHRHHR